MRPFGVLYVLSRGYLMDWLCGIIIAFKNCELMLKLVE
jgi:hypothetical protein